MLLAKNNNINIDILIKYIHLPIFFLNDKDKPTNKHIQQTVNKRGANNL